MTKDNFELLVEFLRKNSTKMYNRDELFAVSKESFPQIHNELVDYCYVRSSGKFTALDWLNFFVKSQFYGYDLNFCGHCDIEVFDNLFRPVRQFSGVFRVIGSIKDEEETEVDLVVSLEDGATVNFDPYTMRILRNR